MLCAMGSVLNENDSSSNSLKSELDENRIDVEWFRNCIVSERAIELHVNRLIQRCFMNLNYEAAWLLKAVTLIDLTTLGGDDTATNVNALCLKAAFPIKQSIINKLLEPEELSTFPKLTTAAVCVYPSRVPDAVNQLKLIDSPIPVASVATGFPSGQYPLSTRLEEIKYCVKEGAREIDIVLDRSLVLGGKWEELYKEVKAMKKACGPAHMKTILATGECGSLDNVAKASIVAMLAGSDFIKTSTGKEAVNATLKVGLVMCRAIRFYYKKTGIKVGLKPAGGLKTYNDALQWLMLVKQELGDEWINPSLFRFGASSLLGNIEDRLCTIAFERNQLPVH